MECGLAIHSVHQAGHAFTVFSFITSLYSRLFPLQTIKALTQVLILSWLNYCDLFPSWLSELSPLFYNQPPNAPLSPRPHEHGKIFPPQYTQRQKSFLERYLSQLALPLSKSLP